MIYRFISRFMNPAILPYAYALLALLWPFIAKKLLTYEEDKKDGELMGFRRFPDRRIFEEQSHRADPGQEDLWRDKKTPNGNAENPKQKPSDSKNFPTKNKEPKSENSCSMDPSDSCSMAPENNCSTTPSDSCSKAPENSCSKATNRRPISEGRSKRKRRKKKSN